MEVSRAEGVGRLQISTTQKVLSVTLMIRHVVNSGSIPEVSVPPMESDEWKVRSRVSLCFDE